jgi:hypothetical protein
MLGQGVSGDRILTAEQGVFADVDNSSSVDMCDVKVLTKMISGIGGVDCSFPDYNSQFSVGDINRDGKVDVSDAAIILQKSISGYSFSDREIYFHDVNKDGIVNVYDSNVIIKNNFGLLELNRISGYRIGDVDRNGKVSVVDSNIVAEYVSGYRDLTELEKALADVNGDGAVGPCDSDIIVKMALRIVTDEKASFVMCNDSLGDVLGDVDGNGSVGVEDVVLFAKDASKGEDVNGDGAVDSCDVTAISELIAGKIGIRGVKNKECVN